MKRLSYQVQALLTRARESALLAVETYNRPSATFRSGAYIVLMVIAWTSLFHAIPFLRRNIKPYYRKPGSRRYEKIGGDYRWWELSECLRQYHRTDNPPARKNLELFIELRNKLEHRPLPRLDDEIFGECQAMLMNFESLLCAEFGDRHAMRTGLSFALQFSTDVSTIKPLSVSKSQQKSFRVVKTFIDNFRSNLSSDVQSDLAYSFKVFLVPKVGAHASKDAIAVEWVKYDPAKPEQMREYEKVVALIKPREIRVANLDLLRPSEVVARVSAGIKKPFNMHHHVLCYRHFNARPSKGSADPKACDTRYCLYDTAHRDYLYTSEWAEHLIKALSEPNTYDSLLGKKSGSVQSAGIDGAVAA